MPAKLAGSPDMNQHLRVRQPWDAHTAVIPTQRRKPVQWERRLQGAIVEFHAFCVINPLEAILFAVPNGEKRDAVTAGILSGRRRRVDLPPLTDEEAMRPAGQGVLPGACDLVLLLSGKTVLIETKVPKTLDHAKGSLSTSQKIFRRSALALGQDYRVLEAVEEYHALLVEHGVRLRIRQLFPVVPKIVPAPPGLKIPVRRGQRVRPALG